MKVADKVFFNGNIYTMNNDYYHAEAIAVKDQKILFVGSNEDSKQYAGEKTEMIDLKGETVIPGIIENHTHLLIAGELETQVLAFNKTKEQILAEVAEAAKTKKPGEWVLGRGWSQEDWDDKAFPTREDLDKVCPDNPVVMYRVCMHCLWVNTKALELAGITDDTKDPLGGEIIRDEKGVATGVLTDAATQAVDKIIPPYTVDNVMHMLPLIEKTYLKNGITTVVDLGAGFLSPAGPAQGDTMIKALKKSYEEDKVKLRSYVYVRPGELLDEYYKNGPEIGLYDDRLTVRGQKIFADGTLGARSAWLLEDYSDRPGHKGNNRMSSEELEPLVKKAYDAGFQTTIHGIGDATLKQIVDVYEKIYTDSNKDCRPRIEHFMIARDQEFERFGKLKGIASMQFVELSSDLGMLEERIGKGRIHGAYAWRKALNLGIKIVAGTDYPVDSVNPFESLYYAVSRCTIKEEPIGGYNPQEALTRYEALRAYTLDGAYGCFEENIKGSIEEGKLADFAVIDHDYMNCNISEIKDIKVLKTIIGGETIYEA